MAIRHILYVSSAQGRLPTHELNQILVASRRNNAPVGVTGLLVYEDGNFMQALEGPPEAVSATLARIHADERHRGVQTIIDFMHPDRAFPDWHMGFEYRDSPRPCTGEEAYSRAELVARLRQPNIMHQLMRQIGAASFFR